MVNFTVTLKQCTGTTEPKWLFGLASSYRLISDDSGQLQYIFEVTPQNCPDFSLALSRDDRVIGWQAQG